MPSGMAEIEKFAGIDVDDEQVEVEENFQVATLSPRIERELQGYHDRKFLIGDEDFKSGKSFRFDYDALFTPAIDQNNPHHSFFHQARTLLICEKGVRRKQLQLTSMMYNIIGLSKFSLSEQKLYIALKWSTQGEQAYGESNDATVRFL